MTVIANCLGVLGLTFLTKKHDSLWDMGYDVAVCENG